MTAAGRTVQATLADSSPPEETTKTGFGEGRLRAQESPARSQPRPTHIPRQGRFP